MLLRLNYNPLINNPRHCPVEAVEELRRLLTQGAPAVADLHRRGFYDVEDGERVFYVHIAPTGSVWLLATWLNSRAAAPPHTPALAEQACACGR